MGKIYRGLRIPGVGDPGVYIIEESPNKRKDCRQLKPSRSQKVCNHSPVGFDWGYGGSGPAQLALALILDVTNNSTLAQMLHQSFKREFVAKWEDRWEIEEETISKWLTEKRKEKENQNEDSG